VRCSALQCNNLVESCHMYKCCSVLQCVEVRCSALQCVAVRCSALQCNNLVESCHMYKCCSVLQCVAVCCRALQCVAVHCSATILLNHVTCINLTCRAYECGIAKHMIKSKSILLALKHVSPEAASPNHNSPPQTNKYTKQE